MSYQNGGGLDYASTAKRGFLLGATLFVVGTIGEVLAHTLVTVPTLVEQVLLGMVATGIVVGLLVPIVFGAVLPLVE